MDDADPDQTPPSLKSAVRKARIEQAERSEVVSEFRRAELARLDLLNDAFKPVLAQVPGDAAMFDCGIAPGERPRLFVDMIAFVEMAHDKRTYRFVQETRHGRVTIAESEKADTIIDAMTAYVARRLVEREAALASDTMSPEKASGARATAGGTDASGVPVAASHARPKRRWRRRVESALLFTIELLGAVVLFILLIGLVYLAWRYGESWWTSVYAQLR